MAAQKIVRQLGIAAWHTGGATNADFKRRLLTYGILGRARRQPADIAAQRAGRAPMATMEFTSINASVVIDTFLLLLIGIGPKVALVPFLEAT